MRMAAPVNFVLAERSLGGGGELLSVEGDTTTAVAERVRKRAEELLEKAPRALIIDLSGVSFVDSAVVQALGDAAATAKKRGSRLLVVEPVDPRVAAPLEMGRLDLVVEVLPTLEQAAVAMQMPPGSLHAAIPAAPAPPEPADRPRRTLFGRRTTDQEILRELGQLRRLAQELRREIAAGNPPANLQAELEQAREEADRMEEEAEAAHARIQVLELELAELRASAAG
jgi:anti-anti-sigma factor